MKTLRNLFNNSMAIAAIAVTTMTASFGLTSCQQDDDFCAANQQTHQTDEMINEIEAEDSLAVTDIDFAYDKFGTTSPKQYIEGFDYTSNGQMQTRSAGGDAVNLLKEVANYTIQNYGDIISNPAMAVVKFTFGKIFENEQPDIKGELENMHAEIQKVENILHSVDGKLDNMEYSRIYNERLKNLISLRSTNCTYLSSYYEYIAEGDTVNADAVIEAWSRKVIHENNIEYTMKEFLALTPKCNNMGQKSVTEIYDFWVFQTTPWEHMGYDKRDALRQGDIVTGYAGYVLLKAFYENDKLINHKNDLRELDEIFRNFCKFYEKNACVKRHYDRIVCQIQNANIVFKKNIKQRDMLNHPWFPNNTSMSGKTLTQFMYGDMGSKKIDSATARKRSLTKKEAEAIYNYYNSEYSENIPDIEHVDKDASGKYSMESIMKSVGFDLSELNEGKQHVMTLDDGCDKDRDFDYNYSLTYNNVVLANDANKPFRSNWKVGLMWIDWKFKTKSFMTYDILRHWHRYDSDNTQFFYTNIEKRYSDMKPFN